MRYLITGGAGAHWSAKRPAADFYDAKGVLEVLGRRVGRLDFQAANSLPSHVHPGKAARILWKGQELGYVGALHPDVVKKYRSALLDRIQKAGLPIPSDDERIVKEITFFADRADISEELTRLESHLAQFAHHLRKNEPVGRTLEFITQEMFRELNTLGAKANDAFISQRVVACKAELEKIREQIQNLE